MADLLILLLFDVFRDMSKQPQSISISEGYFVIDIVEMIYKDCINILIKVYP